MSAEKKNNAENLTLDAVSSTPLITILNQSFRILLKTFIPLLILFIVVSVIVGLVQFLVVDLTNISYNYLQLLDQYSSIADAIAENPDYIVTEADIQIQRAYTIYYYLRNFILFTFQLSIPIIVIMLSAGKIYNLSTNDNHAPNTWYKSILAPFSTPKKAVTSIFLIIILSIFFTLGAIAYIIPGIILMIYFLFSVYALVIDGKIGIETLKASRFYSNRNFFRMIIIVFFSYFLPNVIVTYFLSFFLNSVNLTNANYKFWQYPHFRNNGMLIVYDIVSEFAQNILYIWFPVVYGVAFATIRKEKMKQINIL